MNTFIERLAGYKTILFTHPNSQWLWLIVRVYLGWTWLHAGYEKLVNPTGVWVGEKAGTAIAGFVTGALGKTAEGLALAGKSAAHPDVTVWYGWFLENCVGTAPVLWAYLITFGEIAAGLGLIFGVLASVAAAGALVMNFSFLLAGTVSVNPVLALLTIPLLLAHKVAGNIGVEKFVRDYMEKKGSTEGGAVGST
ncbi:MAG: DoxX family membrane protein [bacterium]|nr:DoxX family membrane protein [bacterium]